MSKRKKKLYARRYQPWYQKRAKLAQGMENALAPRFKEVARTGRMSSSQPNISNIRRRGIDSATREDLAEIIERLEARHGWLHYKLKRPHGAYHTHDEWLVRRTESGALQVKAKAVYHGNWSIPDKMVVFTLRGDWYVAGLDHPRLQKYRLPL
jgi:hypothetical protein